MANGKKKWKYFIGVYEDNKLKYVTETKGSYASWKAGEPAKEFGITTATNICEGLNFNMIPAVVVKAPSFLEIKNDE